MIPWFAGPPPPNNPGTNINGVLLDSLAPTRQHSGADSAADSAVTFTLESTGSESSGNSGLSCSYGDTVPSCRLEKLAGGLMLT